MTELEKIEYTKAFIDKLANGINPLDDTPIPEGDIANNVRLSRCFFYVSDILRQVIENGGVTPPQKAPKAGKQAFTLTEEVRAGLQVSETPLTVSELVSYLNDTVKEENVKRLATTAITGWMVEQGFMEVVELPSGKTAKRPTPTGNEIGLFTEERMGMYGAYTVVKFSPAAQTFVFDHMALIMEHYEGVKAAKKEQKAAAKAARAASPAPVTPSYQPPMTEFLNRPWTETHDDRLRRMAADGATVAEMADAIKRTEEGIRARLRELGIL
jgi:hypothetical protein